MPLPTREQIGEKLLEFPLLRQLVYERWFRVAFGLFIFVFIFLALFLPKIWRTSPKDFLPVVKVSGLDKLQAWSLKRTAMKAMAAGKFDEANYAWQAALANNRADPRLVRGALDCILQDPNGKKLGGQAIGEAFWLLKLTGTNLVDLELATRAFERYRYYDPIIALIEPRRGQLTATNAPAVAAPLIASYLKALFNQGKTDAFQEEEWNALRKALPDLEKDPSLRLYRAAYQAGWAPPEAMVTDARVQLNAALTDPDPKQRLLAAHLQLALSVHELNTAEYGRILKLLEKNREDELANHVGYWRLLGATGEKEKAIALLKAYPHPPTSPIECVQLSELYNQLGMRELGVQLLQQHAKEFSEAPIYWLAYANLLAEGKQWDDLRNLAFQLRGQETTVRDQLGSFSYFLEGRAELALRGETVARLSFQKAAERECPYATLSHRMASQLLQFGFPEYALAILQRHEKSMDRDVNYWLLRFSIADRLKDVETMVKAAQRAYNLDKDPKNPLVMNNYAAALLIARQDPVQAIGLTVQLLSKSPASPYAQINHSGALLLNNRAGEAAELLQQVKTNGFNLAQMTVLNLDWFETYLRLRQWDRAQKVSEQIDSSLLYPTQRKWFEQARQELPPKPKQS